MQELRAAAPVEESMPHPAALLLTSVKASPSQHLEAPEKRSAPFPGAKCLAWWDTSMVILIL